jgi:hypothetical protein
VGQPRKLQPREHVFAHSLRRHGFRLTHKRTGLKHGWGYVIPTTYREDSSGVDFLIKMPRTTNLVEVQITQRGTALFRKHHTPTETQLAAFERAANARLKEKRKFCEKHGICFALVRDFDGRRTNPTLAWGDVKALRHGMTRVSCRTEMRAE